MSILNIVGGGYGIVSGAINAVLIAVLDNIIGINFYGMSIYPILSGVNTLIFSIPFLIIGIIGLKNYRNPNRIEYLRKMGIIFAILVGVMVVSSLVIFGFYESAANKIGGVESLLSSAQRVSTPFVILNGAFPALLLWAINLRKDELEVADSQE
jgi:hypothetical protein